MKRHRSAIVREQRAMTKSRTALRRHVGIVGGRDRVLPMVPADARQLADAVAKHPQWSDDLPKLATLLHPNWYRVLRGVGTPAKWSWECIAEAGEETDAVVMATTQRWWCCVYRNGKRLFDNRRPLKPGNL